MPQSEGLAPLSVFHKWSVLWACSVRPFHLAWVDKVCRWASTYGRRVADGTFISIEAVQRFPPLRQCGALIPFSRLTSGQALLFFIYKGLCLLPQLALVLCAPVPEGQREN